MSNLATLSPGSMVGRLVARLNLRFPVLVGVLAVLTLVNLLVPDVVPFVDEIVLALLTVLAARWKARKDPLPQVTPVPRASRPEDDV